MGMRLRIWWQKVKKPLEIIGVTTALVLIFGLIVLIVAGYIFKWSWTGFGPETSEPKLHAKTLWDWLQLLIIPLVLAVGGYTFNLTVSKNEQQNTRLRDQTEREISLDNQQEAALQAYICHLSVKIDRFSDNLPRCQALLEDQLSRITWRNIVFSVLRPS